MADCVAENTTFTPESAPLNQKFLPHVDRGRNPGQLAVLPVQVVETAKILSQDRAYVKLFAFMVFIKSLPLLPRFVAYFIHFPAVLFRLK